VPTDNHAGHRPPGDVLAALRGAFVLLTGVDPIAYGSVVPALVCQTGLRAHPVDVGVRGTHHRKRQRD
jgi:hypothetical protein